MFVYRIDETETIMIFMRPWFLLLLIAIPFFFHLRKKGLTNNPWKKIIKPEFLHLLMVKTGQTKKSKSYS